MRGAVGERKGHSKMNFFLKFFEIFLQKSENFKACYLMISAKNKPQLGIFFQTLGFQEKNFRIIEDEFTPSLPRSRNAKPSQNRLIRNRVQTLKVKK